MTDPARWPDWIKALILVPHGLLGFCMFWFWWPKTSKQWRWYSALSAYLLLVYFILLRRISN